MVFRLVILTKVKLRPPTFDNEEYYLQSYDMLDFCAWGGQIRRCRVILWGANQLLFGYFKMKKQFGNILSYMWTL